MLDFYLLPIIGFGLFGTAIGFRIARKIYWRWRMDLHAQKVMGLNEGHPDQTKDDYSLGDVHGHTRS